MIIVKLNGGLGNQMFQYAFARKLSVVKKTPVKLDNFLYLDADFGKDSRREYGLGHFNTNENLATREDVAPFLGYSGVVRKLIKKVKRDILRLDECVYHPKYLAPLDNAYLEGYWQSEKYFLDIRDILLKELALKDRLSQAACDFGNKVNSVNAVSLHIRRGDYTSNKKVVEKFGACGLDYYIEAIETMKSKVVSPVLFIFSDDINWVRENLKLDNPVVYVSSTKIKDYEELILMSKCKHNIIANSSFSWWGAWLNQNEKKIVIAPKQWFKTKRMYTHDIVPNSWMKL